MKEIKSVEHYMCYQKIKKQYSILSSQLYSRSECFGRNSLKPHYKKYTEICIMTLDIIIELKRFLEEDYSMDDKLLEELKESIL
jgi:hypothetical protein